MADGAALAADEDQGCRSGCGWQGTRLDIGRDIHLAAGAVAISSRSDIAGFARPEDGIAEDAIVAVDAAADALAVGELAIGAIGYIGHLAEAAALILPDAEGVAGWR
ncbi:MAG: hypothetical protein RML36_14490 [Anaerolineae bacterium]|nr:hypothetical protein [Anaerolineae bacterium]MDW8100678.1 hypothetical protein [Anaerolineae bacterium]